MSDKKAIAFVGQERWDQVSNEEREQIREEVAEKLLKETIEREKRLIALTDKLASMSERKQALHREALELFAADKAADTATNGITFEEIGIDLLLVDEAQNFKNIWAVGSLEGGNPKYLGAIQSGSERGYQLAAYRHNLSDRIKSPGGTYLLSATPAKNSPIEYFTLINLVNEKAWLHVGIPTVESFIERYLYIERREIVQPDMEVKVQSVVSGFRNLVELRDVIFRYAEFKTAQDVGLKLPESKSETILVDMSESQQRVYYRLADKYTATLKKLGHATGGPQANRLKNQALSLLTRMQLCTVHPLLVDGPVTEEHTAFLKLPFSHPDLPREEKDRRLALIALVYEGWKETAGMDIDSLFAKAQQNTEAVSVWADATEHLFNAAKRRWAKTKKLKTQFSYASAGKVADMHAPKLDRCVQMIAVNPGCGQIVFCDNVAVHRWLVELLVEAGVPRERIAVINGEVVPDAQRRLAISDQFNGVPAVVAPDGTIEVEEIEPQFDVVIANQAAYEGIDLHRRTCTVYHLDLPWEPNTLRQRNGRAVRQGNLQSNVDIKVLMARRSLDVVRYEYILGKLRWMSDLIDSADNSLSNPAADNEVDSESMVLFLTRDEESAKAAIESIRASQEAKRRKVIANRAWRDFEALLSRTKSLRNTSLDAERRLIIEEESRKLRRGIEQIPSDIWPYTWILAHLDRDVLIDHDIDQNTVPVIQDWTLAQMVEIGRVQSSVYGWRRFGEVTWQSRDLFDDSDFRNGNYLSSIGPALQQGYSPIEQQSNPAYPDEDLKGQLLALFEQVRASGTFELLGLKVCSASWRKRLNEWRTEIVDMVKRTAFDFLVPIRTGDGFDLVEANDKRITVETLADFDQRTYADFFRYVSTNRTDFSYTAAALTTEQWWGIRLPRGFLRPNTVRYSKPGTGKRVTVRPMEASADLAVVNDVEETRPYLLIHLPSETILRGFATEAVARKAYDLVMNLQDWSGQLAAYELRESTAFVLDTLAQRTEVPSDDELNRWGIQ